MNTKVATDFTGHYDNANIARKSKTITIIIVMLFAMLLASLITFAVLIHKQEQGQKVTEQTLALPEAPTLPDLPTAAAQPTIDTIIREPEEVPAAAATESATEEAAKQPLTDPVATPKPAGTAAKKPMPSAKPKASAAPKLTLRPLTQEEINLADDPLAPAPEAQPRPTGITVQLGGYTSTGKAKFGWENIAFKWPYLATKKRTLVPIATQKDGKAVTRYYWQIATDSQAQSVVICQRLAKAGQPCNVIY